MPLPDIEDWFLKLAYEIERRWPQMGAASATADDAIAVLASALRNLGRKMREEPVVDVLADGTAIAQRPRGLLTINLKPAPPPTITLDAIEDPPQLPGPPHKHASLAGLIEHLCEIVTEARLEPEVFDLAEPWTIDHLLDRIAQARVAIDAVEYHARRVRRDP